MGKSEHREGGGLEMKNQIKLMAGSLMALGFFALVARAEEAPPAAPETPAVAAPVAAPSPVPASHGTMPFSNEPDTHDRGEKRLFPLLGDKARARGKELPPPF